MKKFALAAAVAGSLAAVPAVAGETKAPSADPFVSTQGSLGAAPAQPLLRSSGL